MNGLELRHVSHRFADRQVVDDVNLSIRPGEICCLLGPSGCGKTTTLRIVAGLEEIQAGSVLIDGVEIASPGRDIPPEKRRIGMVFQDYALFPHLTVRENITFGLRGQPATARDALAGDLMRRLSILDLAEQYPHRLSGGEQQRVALARALAPQPRAMLLDEPFANLDARLRAAVRDDTLTLLQAQGTATLMVTHDPSEAMRMADLLAVMKDGRLEQVGHPDEVFGQPATRFVAEFLSEFSMITGKSDVSGEVTAGPFKLAPGWQGGAGEVDLILRPEALCMGPAGEGAEARVLRARNLGPTVLVDAKLLPDGPMLRGHWEPRQRPKPGDVVGVLVRCEKAFVFPHRND